MNSANGDPELAVELDTIVGRRSKGVAAALINIGTEPRTRLAFIAADANTRFEIGSITKALTGMLLADAIGRSEVTLDTEVGAILPRWAGTAFGSITMRELCTHTSGLPRVATGLRSRARVLSRVLRGRDPYRGTSGTALLDEAAHEPLQKRGDYRYSNVGAAVLGQLLAGAAGTDYPSHLRARILLPLGMDASAVGSEHDAAPRGRSSLGRRQQPWIMDGYAPAGAVVSTITDMSRLAASLLDGSAPGCGSLVAIDGVETNKADRATGMFWVIDRVPKMDHTMIWHNGQTGGYSAFCALFPEAKRAVVVLADIAHAAEQQRIALALARSHRL